MFRQDHAPTEAGCWAHARRKFFESVRSDRQPALVAVGFIGELFAIDRTLKDAPPRAAARTAAGSRRSRARGVPHLTR
jgi:transposase